MLEDEFLGVTEWKYYLFGNEMLQHFFSIAAMILIGGLFFLFPGDELGYTFRYSIVLKQGLKQGDKIIVTFSFLYRLYK